MQKLTTTSIVLVWAKLWMLLCILTLVVNAKPQPPSKKTDQATVTQTLKSLLSSAQLAEEQGDLKNLSIHWFQLGQVYIQLEQQEQALPYFEKVVENGKKWVDNTIWQQSLNRLADLCFALKQYGKAAVCYQQLLQLGFVRQVIRGYY